MVRRINAYILGVTTLLLSTLAGRSQGTLQDTAIFTPLIGINYSFYVPGGDMSERFGASHSIGASANFKLASQWLIGCEYGFHFGSAVRQDTILNGLMDSDGQIFNSAGQPTSILLQERGHSAMLNIGRLFPVIGPNPNSGLLVKFGFGYFQHKIRIETGQDNIPQLSKELKKGYDRLTGGFLFNQFIGYNHLSNSRIVNFYAGLDFYQGFTRSLRSYNIDERQADTEDRLDLMFGFKVGWLVPIHRKSPENIYYY